MATASTPWVVSVGTEPRYRPEKVATPSICRFFRDSFWPPIRLLENRLEERSPPSVRWARSGVVAASDWPPLPPLPSMVGDRPVGGGELTVGDDGGVVSCVVAMRGDGVAS